MSVTVSGGQGTPTGTVTVSGAGGACTVTLASGAGSCNLTGNAVGSSQTITASYGGNGTYGPASGSTTLTVRKINPSVSVSVQPNATNVNDPVMATATVSGTAGIATGTVAVSGAGGACMITLVNGAGNCQLVPTQSGNNQTVVGPYSGDSNYMSASATTTINVHGDTAGPILDIDDNGAVDALTDGLMVMRYLLGLTGPSLTTNALGANAQRTDPAAIGAYIDSVMAELDIDGNGVTDGLTDSLMIVRYLFGLRGSVLINNAIGPGATRTTPAEIEAYLQTLVQ
jgi:hypothetical protein